MFRCLSGGQAPLAAFTLFTTLAIGLAAAPTPAGAQQVVQRNFPATALRGTVVFGTPPQITLNGEAARLAPGARIRGLNNMLVLSGQLAGRKATVNYTVDSYGLLMDVWLLRADEAAKTWPKTRAEAAKWAFDPIGQTWTQP